MSALARKLLLGFGLLGLVASGASTYVHYNLLKNPGYTSFCEINATVSCGQAYLSRYGSLFGVPVALGGVLFFALVLVLLWASQHLDNLWRLEAHLGERANAARAASTDTGALRKLRILAS